MDINHLTLEELKIVKDAITQRINELSGKTSQQETLEEAIENTLEENYAYKDDGGDRVYFDTQVEKCIIDMTKWQAERIYSDEEAIQLLIKFNQEIREVNDVIGWFEQFKKK